MLILKLTIVPLALWLFGIIERAHDYLETSFLPGRSFSGPADFNAQLQDWLSLVNMRSRRALGCAPADRITNRASAGVRRNSPRGTRCDRPRGRTAGLR